jgi:nicotinate-nucleotide pyrophosphorylase (carboxylating)
MNCSKESQIARIVKIALKEDIGKGDVTTRLTVPAGKKISAVIVAEENGVLCGIEVAGLAFRLTGGNIRFVSAARDGKRIRRGQVLAKINGPADKILTAERVALNFLGLLSGISTKTRCFVDRVRPYKAKILDTRKTLPGLRILEKYAVRTGGGSNHRFRLDEMVLIKENHIQVMDTSLGVSGLKGLLRKVNKQIKGRKEIEAEVINLSQFKEVIEAGVDIIMLDNMNIAEIRKAVKIRDNLFSRGRNLGPKLEASGSISLDNVKKYAACGVDFISVGELTKDVESLDVSLDIV